MDEYVKTGGQEDETDPAPDLSHLSNDHHDLIIKVLHEQLCLDSIDKTRSLVSGYDRRKRRRRSNRRRGQVIGESDFIESDGGSRRMDCRSTTSTRSSRPSVFVIVFVIVFLWQNNTIPAPRFGKEQWNRWDDAVECQSAVDEKGKPGDLKK